MKVVFYSNFLNHHQLPFCLEMVELTDNNFVFVATEEIPGERTSMGYEDMNKKHPFVLTTYDSKENEERALQLALESDVVIHGSAPEIYVTKRMEKNKLTFRYSERVYKRGLWRAISPRSQKSMRSTHTTYKDKNIYMLCASAYTASDFALVGAYKGKCYKWGYFPEVKTYDIQQLILDKRTERINLLWCGRYLKWKHPEKAVMIAERLKSEGYNFHLNMIGVGEEYNKIESLIRDLSLQHHITLQGAMSPEEVREHMERANIFLFTSDYNEGWGAVLNEAMNSGCAVVASHAIGAVPYLVEHKKNGLVYKDNNINDLYMQVKKFMDSEELREECGENAYQTLKGMWNAKHAAESLINLCEGLLEMRGFGIEEGPCSRDSSVSQWKMYQYIKRRGKNSE